MEVSKIEDRIDKVVIGGAEIQMGFGGVKFSTMIELMEFAKLMACADAAVPIHLRGNPGTCLAICTRALRFGFDPFALAEHSYAMKKSTKVGNAWQDVETIAYDSAVIHAIIEAHAPITGRLRHEYAGEGDERKCTVRGIPKGEKEPLTHESPTLGKLKEARGKNDDGKIKGSPLWMSKPDQQLFYDTVRDWCRKYYPEILLGWYDRDEFEEYAKATAARDVTPKSSALKDRLAAGKDTGRGFSAEHVTKEIGHSPGVTLDADAAIVPLAGTPEPVPVAMVPEPQGEPAADEAHLETALQRGLRLLAQITRKAEVDDLHASICDELNMADQMTWIAACKDRRKALRK